MLKYIFSIFLLAMGLVVLSQNLPGSNIPGLPQGGESGSQPTTMKEMRALRQQVEKDWSIQYVKLSYDVIPLGRRVFKPAQQGQELQASISFYKYFFVLEGGFQDITRENADYFYNCSGNFFRLGPEVNLIKVNPQGGAMTFGLRYARSNFSDNISFSEPDIGFGEKDYSYQNKNANLQWMELTAGLNLIVWKNMHMGYTIRYKVFRKVSGLDVLRPYDVPGFGRYENQSAMGFSYYIGWAIPLKKMEEAPVDGI